jgi:RNA polymerase sigma-70 factor (ECF subfamily)
MNDVRPSSSREETFASLLAANRKRLQAIARSYAWGGAEQDLFQEILLQLWRSLDRFEGRSSLDTWAYRVALNTAIVWRRKAGTEPRERRGTDDVEPLAATAGPRDELAILDEFVSGLGAADKALFVLYLEDLTYRQIAEVTGLSESHVGVKLHRLKRAFMERYL